ncbi:hypothetical protein C9Z70_23025 [Escherichia coli]|nr:hypothetical protein C9Z70_23025 [Escherichia coli]
MMPISYQDSETGSLKYRQWMCLNIRDRLGYMSDTSSNFEMTGTLLGQELRKRKLLRKRSPLFSR